MCSGISLYIRLFKSNIVRLNVILGGVFLAGCTPDTALVPPSNIATPNVPVAISQPVYQQVPNVSSSANIAVMNNPLGETHNIDRTAITSAAPARRDFFTLPPDFEAQQAVKEQPKQTSFLGGLMGQNPFAKPKLSQCERQLQRLGVRFEKLSPIQGKGQCGIARPVKVKSLSGGIDVTPAATLNCPMALAFARWVKSELAVAARMRYASGIKSIHQMSSYSCRTINSKKGGKLSEHAKGNAIDIGTIKLNSGKSIAVKKPGFFAFREKGLLNNIRAESCKYFTTVLGPGSDRYHKDHFHFDLKQRKTNYRHCD